MMEPLINAILLALHNLALVGCAAAPFYNRNLVLMRARRTALCKTCLKFAIGVLICSAFIGFHG